MAMNEFALKQYIGRLVSNALFVIEHKSQYANWTREVASATDKLSLIARNLKNAHNGVHSFGNVITKGIRGHDAYRAKQSINSRRDTLTSIEEFLAQEWRKIYQAIWRDLYKGPADGKNFMELMDMLAGELESFHKKIKYDPIALTKNLPMGHHATVIQRDINYIKSKPDAGIPSLLLTLVIGLRVAGMVGGYFSRRSGGSG